MAELMKFDRHGQLYIDSDITRQRTAAVDDAIGRLVAFLFDPKTSPYAASTLLGSTP